MNLTEKPGKKISEPSRWGFYDTIVPIRNRDGISTLLSVGAASISPDENLLVAQIYPALPRDLGAHQSQLRLYKLIYNLSKQNETEWLKKVEQNKKNFYSESVMSQVDGEGVAIGEPKEGTIDIEPQFSPSGRYIAFNRIDTKTNSVYPMIADTEKPNSATPVKFAALANENAFYPDRVWGWPHHSAVQWSPNKDILWVTSGLEERMYAVRLADGAWQAKLVCGLNLNRGSFAQLGFFDKYFCFTYGNQQNRIYYVNAEEGEDNIKFVDLPEDMNIREVNW